MTHLWPVIGGWAFGLIVLAIGLRVWDSMHRTTGAHEPVASDIALHQGDPPGTTTPE